MVPPGGRGPSIGGGRARRLPGRAPDGGPPGRRRCLQAGLRRGGHAGCPRWTGRRQEADVIALWWVLRALAALVGWLWSGLKVLGGADMYEAAARAAAAPAEVPEPRRLRGPAPGHPERLCPELPLSEVELRLFRELSALPEPPGRGEGRRSAG
ncbi:DUF6059 family protein [Kitasatospora sp. NPDC101447]|uniref:DUF6059 family protein n=1 Tax=Kitasatospora sp. NPDC101447 TaxID=3364102 RepID=UPI00381CD856